MAWSSILFPKLIVKKFKTYGGIFLALSYWIIVISFGLIAYFPFFESMTEYIIWVVIFLTLFVPYVVLTAILSFCREKINQTKD